MGWLVVSVLDERDVRGLPGLGTVVRFVTYRGITAEDIRTAILEIDAVLADKPWAAS